MTSLQSFGLSTSLAVRIYKRFGNDSTAVLTREPYRLAREVWGIGFKTADKIAQAVGISLDAPERLQAGVLHALGASADEGHTLLPEATLVEEAAALLGVEPAVLAAATSQLLSEGELVALSREGALERELALAPFARAESGLASRLLTLANGSTPTVTRQIFGAVDWTAAFGWLTTRQGLNLAPEQETAVQTALTTPVSILTGGPGTGKTHTLRAVLSLAKAKGLRCLLTAPTGRAAKRMEEATGDS